MSKGPVANAVATNVRAIRERRGLSQQQLARALGELGRPTQATAIAKVEAGDRRVDVDDLVALALVLNVSPARLLLSDVDDQHVPVKLAPDAETPAWRAWQWATGEHSLHLDDDDLSNPAVQRQELEWAAERPVWRRVRADHELAKAIRHLSWRVDRLLGAVPAAGGRGVAADAVALLVTPVRRAVDGVIRELDQTEEEAVRG